MKRFLPILILAMFAAAPGRAEEKPATPADPEKMQVGGNVDDSGPDAGRRGLEQRIRVDVLEALERRVRVDMFDAVAWTVEGAAEPVRPRS
ncbi:MAG: hypothetical protein ACE5G3_02130 [Gammaproteobacteria bacterium]